MFKNYLKITIRNLLKYKGYSSINFFGLAFSMALCMVMLLFVKEQISRDHFHENRDRIYRVISHVQFKSNKMDLATSPKRIGTVLKENYTGIDKLVTMKRLNTVGTAAERAFTVRGLYTEPAFFELFSFQLLHGDPKTALASPNSVVLSFEKAQAFFGDQNPIGQSITLKDAGDFIVTGVVDKQTQRTHLQFDALLPFAALPAAEAQQTQVQEWTSSVFRYFNYFLLEKGAHPEQIERSLSEIAAAHYPETLPGKYAFSLQALTDINLGPNLSNKIGSKAPNELVYAMAALVLIVMLTACFNYVNLTVARALKRSLELGVRRVIGAGRWHIVRQLLSESVFFALASALVAFVLLDWLVPAFNGLSMISENLQIRPEALGGAEIYILFFGFAVAVGVLAGIYPALYLSKARPVAALHGLGSQKRPSALSLRKTLLVVQFALSFIFIAFTLQLQQQVEYMLSEDYGFNREHIINVELQETVSYEIFRNEALKLPEVIEVSATSILPVSGEQESTVFQSRHLEKPVGMLYYAVDENFATNLQLQFIAGNNFSSNPAQQILLNESAVKRLGFPSAQAAIGQLVSTSDQRELTVAGVVKDFHFEGLESPIRPLVLTYHPQLFRFANVRIYPETATAAVGKLEKTWKALDKVHPFRYAFFENQIEQNYAEFADAIRLLGLTSGLVILIASLGLLGIATYKIESKTKEIGIRKVLGASVASVVNMLSMDFVKLVLLANVIAGPLTWFAMQAVMQNFAYRAGMSWWVFAAAGGMALLIALLTVSTQAIRAALANPVEALRYE